MPENAISIAREIVRMNTIDREKECAHYLGDMLQETGFEVAYHEYAQDRTTVVARLKGTGEKPPIYFGGHLDVVPLGAQPWRDDPFGGKIIDGNLYGRGTSDMKAGIAAYVAMGLRMAAKPRGKADIVIIMAAGEEHGCLGTYHLADTGVLDRAGAMVIAEPTFNYPILGHRGALWLRLVTTGKTAHGSMPEVGDNAAYKMARAVLKLENHRFDHPPDKLLGASSLCVSSFHSGINRNSVPDRAECTVDIRTIPGQSSDDVIVRIGELLGDEVEIIRDVDTAAVSSDVENEWIQTVYDIVTPYLGLRPEPKGAPYFTDASALQKGCGYPPAVILGPGILEQAHQTDEYCPVHKIEEAVNIYTDIAAAWCDPA